MTSLLPELKHPSVSVQSHTNQILNLATQALSCIEGFNKAEIWYPPWKVQRNQNSERRFSCWWNLMTLTFLSWFCSFIRWGLFPCVLALSRDKCWVDAVFAVMVCRLIGERWGRFRYYHSVHQSVIHPSFSFSNWETLVLGFKVTEDLSLFSHVFLIHF